MSKELLKLLGQINKKKDEVKDLVTEDKIEEAETAKKELENMQRKFNLLKDMEENELPQIDEETGEPVDTAGKPMKKAGGAEDAIHEFATAAKRGFMTNTVDPMNEGTGADGGYTVPEDIQTKINEFKTEEFSLASLVTVENVKTDKGARTYQTKAQASGFVKVDENGNFTQTAAPKFSRITYDVDKFGGYIPVTQELLNDSDANIANTIIRWIGKNSIATNNREILAVLMDKAATALVNLDGIKKAINVTLGQAYKNSVKIMTNDDGLNWLDTLKDTTNRYLLSPDPTEPKKVQLSVGAVVYPVEVVPNSIMPSENVYGLTSDEDLVNGKTYYTRTGSGTTESPYVYTPVATPAAASLASYYEVTDIKIPFEIGDFKEAVAVYDRQKTTILASNTAAVTGYNAFEQGGVLYRADIRADYKAKDTDAWVNGYVQLSF